MKLTTSLEKIKGVGPKTAAALSAAGLVTVEDALNFLPRTYDDYDIWRQDENRLRALETLD